MFTLNNNHDNPYDLISARLIVITSWLLQTPLYIKFDSSHNISPFGCDEMLRSSCRYRSTLYESFDKSITLEIEDDVYDTK